MLVRERWQDDWAGEELRADVAVVGDPSWTLSCSCTASVCPWQRPYCHSAPGDAGKNTYANLPRPHPFKLGQCSTLEDMLRSYGLQVGQRGTNGSCQGRMGHGAGQGRKRATTKDVAAGPMRGPRD